MSGENEIRSNLAKAIHAAIRYPRPAVRDEMLLDAVMYISETLVALGYNDKPI